MEKRVFVIVILMLLFGIIYSQNLFFESFSLVERERDVLPVSAYNQFLPLGDHGAELSAIWEGEGHAVEDSLLWPPEHSTGNSIVWPPEHDPLFSISWPPEHEAETSVLWPPEHDVEVSLEWPPNHDAELSAQWDSNNHDYVKSEDWRTIGHDFEVSLGWPDDHNTQISTIWLILGHSVPATNSWVHGWQFSFAWNWPVDHDSDLSEFYGENEHDLDLSEYYKSPEFDHEEELTAQWIGEGHAVDWSYRGHETVKSVDHEERGHSITVTSQHGIDLSDGWDNEEPPHQLDWSMQDHSQEASSSWDHSFWKSTLWHVKDTSSFDHSVEDSDGWPDEDHEFWASQSGHEIEVTQEFPEGHKYSWTTQGHDTQESLDLGDHSLYYSQRNHFTEQTEVWRQKGHSDDWSFNNHPTADTHQWELGHDLTLSSYWKDNAHSVVTTKSWNNAGHDLITTRLWTSAGHSFESSLEWPEGHLLFVSLSPE